MISIVIPAHNEEQVIGRLLEGVTRGAEPGELEIVVVTNGCTDRTAEVAASFPGVTVVDSPVASKAVALNLGDATVTGFPRLYLDADIEVDIAARPGGRRPRCAAATPTWRHQSSTSRSPAPPGPSGPSTTCGPASRSCRTTSSAGSTGSPRPPGPPSTTFPDTFADDMFVHSLVPASRRLASSRPRLRRAPASDLAQPRADPDSDPGRQPARARALFAEAAADIHAGHMRELRRLARRPRMLPHVAVYVGVMVLVKAKARWRNRSKSVGVWDRDTLTRAQAGAR